MRSHKRPSASARSRNRRTASTEVGVANVVKVVKPAVRSAMHTLTQRSSDTRRRVNALTHAITRQAKQHPGRFVAIALGAGYFLGGGLFSAFTGRVLGVGLRMGLRAASVPLAIAALSEGLNDSFTSNRSGQS